MFRSVCAGTLILALGIAGCGQTQVDPTTPDAFESAYFTITQTGAGPDIILMPGLASSGDVWDGVVDSLASEYTLHVVQVSGFSGAPARGNQGNMDVLDDLASDLATYTQTLDDGPQLVGHSLGGLVALKTALEPNSNLSNLVIVDVLPFFSVLMDPAATVESIKPVSAVMKATLLSQSDEVFALRQEEALMALVKGKDNLQLVLSWSLKSDRGVMAQAMSEVLVADLREEIKAISIPTTIIYAKDEAIPNMPAIEAYYESLYASIPDHSLIAIEGAFHFIMLDQPDTFQTSIEAALERQACTNASRVCN